MPRTLTDVEIAGIAAAHERARVEVAPIDPPSRSRPDMTLDDAYAIQHAWIDLQVNRGAVVRGRKIGLTSRAMQQAMKIDEPDFGALLDYMFLPSGGSIRAADHLDPKLEVELAFVLRDDLDLADPTADDVYAATEHVVPALELIDARSYRVHPVDGATRTVKDTISDNAADSGIVLGDHAVRPRERDLKRVGAVMSRNGTVEETGLAAGVLGDPVLGVVWLARRLHGLGIPLRAGETVLAGSFTRPVDCRAGDEFVVDYGDLGVVMLSVV